MRTDYEVISVAEIRDPTQDSYREAAVETADQIKESVVLLGDLIQPVVVRPLEQDSQRHRYELVVGRKRLLAFKNGGRDTIPARIVELDEATARLWCNRCMNHGFRRSGPRRRLRAWTTGKSGKSELRAGRRADSPRKTTAVGSRSRRAV